MINYRIVGIGIPKIVLIHGFPNDNHSWDTLLPFLKTKHALLLPDLPGAGKSTNSTYPLTMEMMANSVVEVMNAVGMKESYIAGHSMGGYTAINIAAMFPEKVKAISFIHSAANNDSATKIEHRKKAIQLFTKGLSEKKVFLKAMAQNLFASEFANNNPDIVQRIIEQGSKLSTEALSNFYTAIMYRKDYRPILEQLKIPVQWVMGTEDTATPITDILPQVTLSPVNQINLYFNCGHMSMFECPKKLSYDLDSFWQYCDNYIST